MKIEGKERHLIKETNKMQMQARAHKKNQLETNKIKLFIKDTMMLGLMAKKSKKTKNQLKTKQREILIKDTNVFGFMAKKYAKQKIN